MEIYSKHSTKPYYIKTDYNSFDKKKIHYWLAVESYWAKGRDFDMMEKAFKNSLVFGLFHTGGEQIGVGRYVTDRATIAYMCDVYIDKAFQGQGLGHWFIEESLKHPDLQGLLRMMLATSDQHQMYEKFGFVTVQNNKVLMEKLGKKLF